ncbi:CHASE2 domain-containing protein [Acidovorax sp. BL-A-41-H1]|uniref:CHASE2 domain-containing protein n=1 Tax=Acidovorax sp. BL-A-41-H1 TaxID=3421102 RepID=UPI003F794F8C
MTDIARTRSHRRRLEWTLLSAVLLALVAWLSLPGNLDRANHVLHDAGTRFLTRTAQPDIVVVAIDDQSIAAIGRWPWRRALHAEAIRRIDAQGPRAIGFDVLFNDEDLDYPQDDLLLANAIRSSGRVVLPVLRREYGPAGDTSDLPLPAFADAAAALGHVHVAPDTDGVVRSLYLQEGPAAAPWQHFSAALHCVAQQTPVGGQPCKPQATSAPEAAGALGSWQRTGRTLINYAGGPSHFPAYSYIDVLRGAIPADAFKGKYVLLGASASGLGDMFATPTSAQSRLMPGVEVVAHVLDARLAGLHVQPATTVGNLLFSLVPVLCAMVLLLVAGPFAAMAGSAVLAVGTLLLSMALARWAGVQFAPAAALAGIVLAYPLWSWRRLNAAADFLQMEMDRLKAEGLGMRLRKRPQDASDLLERRINAVERASRQLRELHHFVSDSLQQLPSPTLVCDEGGGILLANRAAHEYAASAQGRPLRGQSVVDLLHELVDTTSREPVFRLERLQAADMPPQTDAIDAQGKSLLVQCRPFSASAQAAWLITLVDLTEMRNALRQRDEALHFISHDIRAPNSSILTLLEMQRAYPDRMDGDELMQRIERYARASLDMAENFVQLASAQSQDYRMAPLDLTALLAETVDDMWALARSRSVRITIESTPEYAPITGDRALLGRALTNVLHNAVKFSPDNGTIRCAIEALPDQWAVSVRDEGPGIDPALQGRLFTPFQRLHDRSHPTIGGVGLGLALVRTVIVRHGGALEVASEPGHGAEFRVLLPAAQVHAMPE